MARPRGIGEIPLQHTVGDKTVPLDSQLRRVLVDLREQVIQLRQRQAIPDPPTNVRATAQPFQNLVQWTRSSDADYYEVLHALTPALTDPHLQTNDAGNSAQWQDHVGQSGIQKFYWVRARKRTGASSLEVGPANATTLVSTPGVTPPAPPPPSNIIVTDQNTGRQIPYTLTSPRSFRS